MASKNRRTTIHSEIEVNSNSGTALNFGHIQRASTSIANNVITFHALGNGAQPKGTLAGMAEISGTIEWLPVRGDETVIIGSKSGTNTWSVTPKDTLEEYIFKGQIDSTHYAAINDVKFGKFSMSAAKDEILSMSTDFKGKAMEIKAGTVSTETTTKEPFIFLDGSVKLGSIGTIGSVSNFAIDYDRELVAAKGIEDTTGSAKRQPTDILEKTAEITFRSDIEVTGTGPWKEALGGAQMSENLPSITAEVNFASKSGNTLKAKVTGLTIDNFSEDENVGGDIIVASIDGKGTGIKLSGTYA